MKQPSIASNGEGVFATEDAIWHASVSPGRETARRNKGDSALICGSEVGEHLLLPALQMPCERGGGLKRGSSLIQQRDGIMGARLSTKREKVVSLRGQDMSP